MANQKSLKKSTANTPLEVDTTPVASTEVENYSGTDFLSDETVEVDVTSQVDVEVQKDDSAKVVVDTSAIDEKKKPEERVKIRLRVDHKCTIAMERYDFKAGSVYKVPRNVKKILNKAGLLSPI